MILWTWPSSHHLEMDSQRERSDRDSVPAPFIRNSYFPKPQQYYDINYYGSQCYHKGPLPQYYYLQQNYVDWNISWEHFAFWDQFVTGNHIKRNALSQNLGIYFDWLTFEVTKIICMSQVWPLLQKQKFVITKFSIFLHTANQIFWCSANRPWGAI